jgi:prophage regulatory protein
MAGIKDPKPEAGMEVLRRSRARRMLNEQQVLQIVPVGRTTLYRMEKAGKFPRSTYISPNRKVWFEDEIVSWQNAVDQFDPNRRRGQGRRASSARLLQKT